MELFFNDLSIHGQFPNLTEFKHAINRLMSMRQVARRFGRELYCHRNVTSSKVTQAHSMLQAIQVFNRDEQQAVLHWLTRQGPFWDDAREHNPDDYFECRGEVVTDTAVGEAAYCCLNGAQRRLLSLIPSSWVFSPVSVSWVLNTKVSRSVDVANHWNIEDLENTLRLAPPLIESWELLETRARERYASLVFSPDCFEPLRGHPFVRRAALHIMERLDVLDRLKTSFHVDGYRTDEGHWLYQQYFTGEKAWFSDSSDSEKREFNTKLTFRHPTSAGESLFCSWHAKVKTPQLRVHFSWPITAAKPLYVVFVGPKISKR